jgi:predicted transposase/invertase (TIGR01784 family)
MRRIAADLISMNQSNRFNPCSIPSSIENQQHVFQTQPQKSWYQEMSKFGKSEEELETRIDKWCYALKNLANLRKRLNVLSDKIFAKLFREAEIARFTEEERMSYEESLKRSRDYRNTIATSFKQGKVEGKIEGEREGIVKGKFERDKEFVRNAIKKNLSVSMIAELTGLSRKKVEALKKQLEEEASKATE